MIRSLELKLELLEHGLALPRDEYAIAHTKTLLEEARASSHPKALAMLSLGPY